MKRNLIRLFALLLTLALGVSPLLVSCGARAPKDLAYTRITLGMGAQVELFIDKNEVVLSATALNDDGCVILDRDPVGEDVVWVVRRLITETIEYGIMPRGSAFASDNTVAITVSGETRYAEKLWEKLLSEAADTLRVEGTSGSVLPGDKPTADELALLISSASHYNKEELSSLDETALLSVLAALRLQTAELVLPDTSRIYLHNLADMTSLLRYSRVKELLLQMGTEEQSAAFTAALATYRQAVEKLCEVRYTAFAAADGDYMSAVRDMRALTVEMVELCREMSDLSLTTEEYGKKSDALDALSEEHLTATDQRDAFWQSGHLGISLMNKQVSAAKAALDALIEGYDGQIRAAVDAVMTEELTVAAHTAYSKQFLDEHAEDLALAARYLEEYRAALDEK